MLNKGPQEDLAIKDLDEETTKGEVLDALKKMDGDESDLTLEVVKSWGSRRPPVYWWDGTMESLTACKENV